jgi:hypothetical protein
MWPDFLIFTTSSAQRQINNEMKPLGRVLRPHLCLSLGREHSFEHALAKALVRGRMDHAAISLDPFQMNRASIPVRSKSYDPDRVRR